MSQTLSFTVDRGGHPATSGLDPSKGSVEAVSLNMHDSGQADVRAFSMYLPASDDSVRSFSANMHSDPFFSNSPTEFGSSPAPARTLIARTTLIGNTPGPSTVKTLKAYHQYGPKSAREYDLTAAQQATFQDHYRDLKGALHVPPHATHFSVNFTLQTASYRKANGERVTVPIDGNIPAFRQASALLRKEVYGGHFQHAHFNNSTKAKGSLNGPKALVRPEQSRVAQFPKYTPLDPNNPTSRDGIKSIVLECIPPEKRAEAKKRIDHAEAVLDLSHRKVREEIDEIQDLQEKLANKEEDLEIERDDLVDLESLSQNDEGRLEDINLALDAVRKEIKDLENQLKEKEEKLRLIEGTDIYALYMALAFYPDQNDPEQVRAAADQLYELILRYTEERINASRFAHAPLIGRFFREGELKEYKEYAADAAGVLFAGLGVEGREAYAHYCSAHRIPMKKQTREDALFHGAIRESI